MPCVRPSQARSGLLTWPVCVCQTSFTKPVAQRAKYTPCRPITSPVPLNFITLFSLPNGKHPTQYFHVDTHRAKLKLLT